MEGAGATPATTGRGPACCLPLFDPSRATRARSARRPHPFRFQCRHLPMSDVAGRTVHALGGGVRGGRFQWVSRRSAAGGPECGCRASEPAKPGAHRPTPPPGCVCGVIAPNFGDGPGPEEHACRRKGACTKILSGRTRPRFSGHLSLSLTCARLRDGPISFDMARQLRPWLPSPSRKAWCSACVQAMRAGLEPADVPADAARGGPGLDGSSLSVAQGDASGASRQCRSGSYSGPAAWVPGSGGCMVRRARGHERKGKRSGTKE